MKVEFIARRARLRYLNDRITPAVDIAYKGIRFSHAERGDIFPKTGCDKIIGKSGIGRLPIGVMLARIVAQRSIRSAMETFFSLLIADEPEFGKKDRRLKGLFGNRAWFCAG